MNPSCLALIVGSIAASAAPLAASAKAVTPIVSCADLAKVALPEATVTSIESVASEQYKIPQSQQGFAAQPGMNLAGRIELGTNPAFCKFAATLRPSQDSQIRIEVWLPQTAWNGKLLGVGNFGWAGSIPYPGMLVGLQEGYAAVSTDTGHDSSTAGGDGGHFSLGHPEKLIDYAYRADHAMTLDAKTLIKAFYGVAPAHSYWIGCSLGGLEGLIEAKRYPTDYDGIVAGAPPNPLTRFNALQLWPSWLISQDPTRLIPAGKYAMVHAAVLRACASPLGLKEGFVDEPDTCHFDPAQLQCKASDEPDCLTIPQVDLLQQTYAGPRNPRTGESIFIGPARGAELEMFGFANGGAPWVALDLFRYAAFQDTAWNWKAMDWDKDVATAVAKVGPLLHVDSNLGPFFAHGGKLLMYIGWTDYHNPQDLVEYYRSLGKNSGGEHTSGSLRLFTIPGMAHCGGGAGCDTFNKLGVIDDWVDHGHAPERIPAARVGGGKILRTRPLCAYPTVARYSGSGDTNDAAKFVCVAQAR